MKRLILFLLFFILLQPAYAQYAGGNGTESDPYLISNSTQFNNIKLNLNASYRLIQDIDFSGGSLTPIGTPSNPFTGNFNGDGYKLKNFILSPYTVSTAGYYSIFGYVSGSSIKNLIVEEGGRNDFYDLIPIPHPTNYRQIYAGILASVINFSSIESIKIENSILVLHNFRSKQSEDEGKFESYSAGLVGVSYNSTITNCSYSNGEVGHAYYLGTSGTLDYGIPYGEIYQGGLVGKSNFSNISRSFFNGEFAIYGNLGYKGVDYIGGLVGYSTGGHINNSYAIHTTGTQVLADYSWDMRYGDIYYSGFISLGSTPVSYCYSIMDPTRIPGVFLTGVEEQVELGYFSGSQYTGIITNCISTDYYNPEWGLQLVGKFNLDVVYGTLDTLKEETFFTDKGFDFDNIWAISPTKNSGYPYIGTAVEPPPPPDPDLPPGAPDIWSPSDNTINADLDITLKWNAPETGGEVDFYLFEVKTLSDSSLITSGIVSNFTLQYYLTNIFNYSTTYIWRIAAGNDFGTTYSNYFTFTTKNEPVVELDPPILTSPENNAIDIILPTILQWQDVIGATGYEIQLRDVNNISTITMDTTSATSELTLSISSLEDGTKYVWSVRATSATDTSEWRRRYFTTHAGIPDIVTFVNPANNDTGIVIGTDKITWNYQTNTDYIQIWVEDTSTAIANLIKNVYLPDTNYLIRSSNGFEDSTWYRLRGRAFNEIGASNWTDWILFKTSTPPPIPAGFDTTYLSVTIDTSYQLGGDGAAIANEGIWDTVSNKIWFGGRERVSATGDAFLGYIDYVEDTSIIVHDETSLATEGIVTDWWGASHYITTFTTFGMSGWFVRDDSLLINGGFGTWRSGVDVEQYPRIQILNLNTLQKDPRAYYRTLGSNYKAGRGSYLSLYTNYIPERKRIIDYGLSRSTGQVMVIYSYAEDTTYTYNSQLNDFGEWNKGGVRGSYFLNDSLYIFTTSGDSIHFYSKYYPKDESYIDLREGWEINEEFEGDVEIIDKNHVKDKGYGYLYFDNNYDDSDDLWAEISESGSFTIIAFAKPLNIENGLKFNLYTGTAESPSYIGLLQAFDGRFRFREPSGPGYLYPNEGTSFSDSTYEIYSAVVNSDSVTFYYKGKKEGDRINHVGDVLGSKVFLSIGWNRLTAGDGQLQEIRYYNSALSDEEVDSISQRIYNIYNNRKEYLTYYNGITPTYYWTLRDKNTVTTSGDTLLTWSDIIQDTIFTERLPSIDNNRLPRYLTNYITYSYAKNDMMDDHTYKIKVNADTTLQVIFSRGAFTPVLFPIDINDSTYVPFPSSGSFVYEDKIIVKNINDTSSYIGSIEVRDTTYNIPSIPYNRYGYKYKTSIPNYNFVTSLEFDKANETVYFLLTNSNTSTSPWTRRGGGAIYYYNQTEGLVNIQKPSFSEDSTRISSIFFKQTPQGKDYSVLWVTFTDTAKNENFMMGYVLQSKTWSPFLFNIKRIEITRDILGEITNIDTFHITPQRMFETDSGAYVYLNVDKTKWVDVVGDQTENAYYVFKLSEIPTVINYIKASINVANNVLFQAGKTYSIPFTSGAETNIIEVFDSTNKRISINTLIDGNNIYILNTPREEGRYKLKITPSVDIGTNTVIVADSIYFNVLNRNIQIITANTNDKLNISLSVATTFIDSFKVFYGFNNSNYKLVNSWETSKDIDTININFSIQLPLGDFGKLFLKVETGKDTSNIFIQPRRYHKTGLAVAPDKRICYSYSLRNAIKTDWGFDVACGWAALAQYVRGSAVKIDNFIYPKYNPEYADTISLESYAKYKWFSWQGGCEGANKSRTCWSIAWNNIARSPTEEQLISGLIDAESRYYLLDLSANTVEIEGGEKINSTSSYFSIHNSSFIYKGYRYWVDEENAKVYVDDLVNGIDQMLLCDYSDLYTSSSQWIPAYFNKKNVIYSFSIFPFSKIIENTYFVGDGVNFYRYEITQQDFDSLLTDQTILNTFVPELRIIGGEFNASIAIPLLGEAPDPLIYDTYSLDLTVPRNYFRGIKPRANRHQKYPYNLKGR